MPRFLILTISFLLLSQMVVFGQNCNSMNFQFESDIISSCDTLSVTMMHDNTGKPFLYIAEKEGGLKIYDVTNPALPQLSQSIPVTNFNALQVMNLSQYGDYLYLAIGNFFGNNKQNAGMAIVDVSNPATAFVTDYWELALSPVSGSGIVKVEGDYAYVGAMGNGLIILDVSDKSSIQFVSQFIPDLFFPDPSPDPAKYNARGMEVNNNIVYLCYDAGGLRIINVSDKNNPVQTGRFSNPVMNGLPRAYNNIVLDDTLAYVTVDYCGLEVLNISDTSNITLTGWWNPYNCPNNNWFSSPGHANEIQLNKNCHQLYLSTGKSDLHVLDVTNPAQPDSCNFYGGVSNGKGTWGVNYYADQIYLSYVCALIPFTSIWSGVEIISYTTCSTGILESGNDNIKLFPNPAKEIIELSIYPKIKDKKITISGIYGQAVLPRSIEYKNEKVSIDISNLDDGIYVVNFNTNTGKLSKKFVKYTQQ